MRSKKQDRIFAEKMAVNGLRMTVTEYADSRHITVTFEDGQTVLTTWQQFENGSVGHPYLRKNRWNDYMGYRAGLGIKVNGKVYYRCIDKDGKRSLMTPQEMISMRLY